MSKTLVAFYSRAGENYFGGNMKMLEVGNTEVASGIFFLVWQYGICCQRDSKGNRSR